MKLYNCSNCQLLTADSYRLAINIPWCSPMCSFHCLSDVLPIPLRDLTHDFPRRVHDRSGIGSIWTLLSSTDIHLKGTVNANEGGRGGGREWRRKEGREEGSMEAREGKERGTGGEQREILRQLQCSLDTDSCIKRDRYLIRTLLHSTYLGAFTPSTSMVAGYNCNWFSAGFKGRGATFCPKVFTFSSSTVGRGRSCQAGLAYS